VQACQKFVLQKIDKVAHQIVSFILKRGMPLERGVCSERSQGVDMKEIRDHVRKEGLDLDDARFDGYIQLLRTDQVGSPRYKLIEYGFPSHMGGCV
jgi:hypothetical protein